MKDGRRFKTVLRAVNNYFAFFLLVAFVVTCCMMLFLSTFAKDMGIALTGENLGTAAKLTLVNVLLISLLFTVIDAVRRKLTVARPVKHISEAAERMMQGDFNVRISHVSKWVADDKFNDIVDCINKLAEELSGVETLRTDFVAHVSHEMKTPLAVMQNYAKLLETPHLPEEKRVEYARAITDATGRLSDMMTNVLRLNRLENQKIYPCAETYDLGEQLCECLLRFENVWEAKSISIDTDIAEGVRVNADGELLSLVWNNLFSNAFKFTEAGGTVSLSLAVEGERAVVKVTDTGCGMSPEVGAHIFEKFYQGDPSRATQGNGLGLALVKRVMDIVEGEIDVESEIGVGSTFTVRIARCDNEG